jgi:methylmalonyl-CoA mutase N-terminal domain/subunit
MGGALAAIEQGFQQREIQEAAFRFQQQIEAQQRIVVGVNEYIEDEPPIAGLMRVTPEVGERQKERLRRLRAERNAGDVERLLGRLEHAASGTENMVPLFIESVEAGVTLGEICAVLRGVWGEYQGALAI